MSESGLEGEGGVRPQAKNRPQAELLRRKREAVRQLGSRWGVRRITKSITIN